jgi:nucleotide-binding universal stress UspA family protein
MAVRIAAARRYLAEVAADFWRQGVRVQTSVRSGQPITEICAAARELGADLIAMSTRARNTLEAPSTSVADGVLRAGSMPVFAIQQRPAETGSKEAKPDRSAVLAA